MTVALVKHGNAAAGHHRIACRVGLSASMAALRLLQRTMAIRGEARLTMNADRPTEHGYITLKEYSLLMGVSAGTANELLFSGICWFER